MKKQPIAKVLIANRGEIALRIMRACKALGIKSAAILSEADKNSYFARAAEEVLVIGPAPAKESYLNVDKIIQAARDSGCDAVHPGYGFLSENADFAKRVIAAGLNFIGPKPETIEIMGNKTRARQQVKKFGVPCTPGCEGGLSDEQLVQAGKKIGFPVIVKAVAGGGGRGMRIAHNPQELEQALPRAHAEALKFFADERVYLEKYIELPRHVEVQVFGDRYGNLIHLGTRDCSVQRRHQKIIEEAPAPNLSPKLRSEIHKAALKAAQSVNYEGAGTVEFLVSGENFYFLEMNTRIQVEHPVTEEVTGIDLVQLQLKVASGQKLGIKQSQVKFSGHAIEFRVCAEDVCNNFVPTKGKITKIIKPSDTYLREELAYQAGDEVGLHYDGLLSKLIVKGSDRLDAIEKSRVILNTYEVEGLSTTLDLERWILENHTFCVSNVDIGFVEREFTSDLVRNLTIRDLRAARVRDPAFVKPIGGALMKNVYEYTSERFKTKYMIEILHGKDGFFLAVPVDQKGRRAANKYCRRSNGMSAVIKSLINDVLEIRPPAEVFEQ